jgi:hypothetical protein
MESLLLFNGSQRFGVWDGALVFCVFGQFSLLAALGFLLPLFLSLHFLLTLLKGHPAHGHLLWKLFLAAYQRGSRGCRADSP